MIQRPRGTRDILPPESRLWEAVEREARAVFTAFGAEEIRTPVFEHTDLFVRSVGEATDIVHKEMYTFADRKGRSLTLRPENTAGVARAWIENRLGDRSLPLRLYYVGPMFRYERMQRGRYRQFAQIGLEILGAASPLADVEILLVLHELFTRLGFTDLEFHLNNLGDPEDRPRYVATIRERLEGHREELCGDCRRRLDENPLRVLDCKVPRCQELVASLPGVDEVAGEPSQEHMRVVEQQLEKLGIRSLRDPRLVRGLDYYVRTVFEVVSPELGSGTVLCGGGRYDRLISDLGGPALPGTGFAIGEDRLIEVLPDSFRREVLSTPRLYLVPLGEAAEALAMGLARDWVRAGVEVEVEVTGRSLRSAFKRADKDASIRAVAIIGEDELAAGTVTVRNLASGAQEAVPVAEVPARWRDV